jgi:DNA polymerase
MADPDDHRVRDLVRYHGAATGRWAGSGIQVQNFPRGNLEELTGVKGFSIDQAVEDVKTCDLEWCEFMYGDVLALLSSCTRGALISAEGKVFYVADYSAIEARIVLWLAEAEKALDVFRRGDDIYCDMASAIYGRSITKKDKVERQLGKVTILGLGYGMGHLTFLLNLRGYDMHFSKQEVNDIIGPKLVGKYKAWVRKWLSPKAEYFLKENRDGVMELDEVAFTTAKQQARRAISRLRSAREEPAEVAHELALCKYLVDMYRKRYPEVTELWKRYEKASLEAVESPGTRVPAGKVTWVMEGRFLRCYLPSGRFLTYADAHIQMRKTPWGTERPEVRYWGVHKKTKRWSRMGSYGGAWTENVDQATARDVMAYAFVQADASEVYIPITTIHDELLSEADEGTGSVKEFEALLVNLPSGYEGCPIAAEGGTFTRYRK